MKTAAQRVEAFPARVDLSALGFDDGRAAALDVLECVLRLLDGSGTAQDEARKDRICRAIDESNNPELLAGFDEVIVGSKAHDVIVGSKTPDLDNLDADWATRFRQAQARRAAAIKRGDAKAAADSAAAVAYLAREFHLATYWRHAITHSAKFPPGRKLGSGGPIRKAIDGVLRKNPALKAAGVWTAVSEKPPRGWTFRDNRVGKYIEGPKPSDGMKYTRFRNVVREEKAKLKA